MGELMMGGKLVEFAEGSCAEEESRIRARIKEMQAADAADNGSQA